MLGEVDDKVVTVEASAGEVECGYLLLHARMQRRAHHVRGSDSGQ